MQSPEPRCSEERQLVSILPRHAGDGQKESPPVYNAVAPGEKPAARFAPTQERSVPGVTRTVQTDTLQRRGF